MPRRARVVVPGVPHHVTQRGNNCQQVFFSGRQRTLYLELIREHAAHSGVRVLAYCLMSNHVHFVLVPKDARSLGHALGRAHSEYALTLNRFEGRSGHLWQNRFFSCALGPSHLLAALQYVDLNPVRAGLVESACEWEWSSARGHSAEFATDPVLDSLWREYVPGWTPGEWQAMLEDTSESAACGSLRRATQTGEPWGSKEFVEELERKAARRLRVLPRGRPPQRASENASVPFMM